MEAGESCHPNDLLDTLSGKTLGGSYLPACTECEPSLAVMHAALQDRHVFQ